MSFIGRRRSAVLKQAQRQAARSPEECEGSERQEESTETHYRDGEAREEVEKKEEEVDSSVLREAEEGAVLVVDSIDEQLKTERYKRTKEQEDDLGLTDMKV
ncbi:ZPR1 zinc finger protein [Toxoplasma gondii MAS]|nr:ZPR1 zinc finger protein [Toxoplasma gondii MAS]